MNILMPINVLTKIFTASYHKKDKGKVILKPGLLKHLLNLIPAPCSALFTYLEAWRVHQSIPTLDAPHVCASLPPPQRAEPSPAMAHLERTSLNTTVKLLHPSQAGSKPLPPQPCCRGSPALSSSGPALQPALLSPPSHSCQGSWFHSTGTETSSAPWGKSRLIIKSTIEIFTFCSLAI